MNTLIIASIKTVAKLLLIIFVGYVSARTGVLNKERTSVLSVVLTDIALPCMLLAIGFTARTAEKTSALIYVFVFTLIAQLFCVVLANIFIKKNNNPHWQIERSSASATNAGILGGTIITSMLGAESMFYITGGIVSCNVVIFTYVLWTMSGNKGEGKLKEVFTSKSIIALIAALILYFLPVSIPGPVMNAVNAIGDMASPLSLIIAGSSLVGLDLRPILKKKESYIVLLIRLIISPLCLIPLFMLFPQNQNAILGALIVAGASTPTLVPVFSLKYNQDYSYASLIMTVSLVLCILTMPLHISVLSLLLKL